MCSSEISAIKAFLAENKPQCNFNSTYVKQILQTLSEEYFISSLTHSAKPENSSNGTWRTRDK